jgi:hypothetical protein
MNNGGKHEQRTVENYDTLGMDSTAQAMRKPSNQLPKPSTVKSVSRSPNDIAEL